MALLCHPWFTTTNLSYRFPIFETSATALCGTTGIIVYYWEVVPSLNSNNYTKYLLIYILIMAIEIFPNYVKYKITFDIIPNSRSDLFL